MFKSILSACIILASSIQAQSLDHPTLYTTDAERTELLQKINNNAWATDLVNSMKKNVDPKITAHASNPANTFSSVGTFPANDKNPESFASPYASEHSKVLSTAAYSGMLYHITKDEKYASFAADILAYYFDNLNSRTEATTTITGNYFYDPRTSYNQLAVAYDFIYDYLKVSGRQVYQKSTNKRVAYDHQKSQKVIRNIAARTLDEAGGLDTQGKVVSNHPVLTSPGSLFAILCVDDKTERERLFNLFWDRGTKRQNSFTKTILKMYTNQSLWPESPSYGFMPNTLLILNLVDRVKPTLNVARDYVNLFESPSLLENLRIPNRYFIRYGDSHRKSDGTDNMNRYALNYAKRRGNTELQKGAEIALMQSFPVTKGYHTSVPANGFENFNALELFWGEPLPPMNAPKFDYKPTVIINHAGVALQRNYSDEDTKEYGLVGVIGGANYVHAHLTGISMELYGSGDVMAPNGGLPPSLAERSTMPFQGYFNRYAGNNTVIVNGTSHGSSKATWGGDKEIGQDLTINVAAEPKHLANPISKDFSFATQFLDDNVNDCDQQRTLSTIRTSPTTAYYIDIFRSKSNKTNNFQDYIYHNIGDATQLTDAANKVLSVSATTKYNNDIGDSYQSPGWRTFEQTKSTAAIDKAVNIRFDLNTTKRYMHMLLPAGVSREYTTALGPATYEALNGYENKKTQIVAIRQNGEAWTKPYVSIFEPSKNTTSSVQSVENLKSGSKIVGAKVISKVDGTTITDYIISNENTTDTYTSTAPAISFKGRFAVVRVKGDSTTLYIGEGTELSYENNKLTANSNKTGLKVISQSTPPTNVAPTLSIAVPSSTSNLVFEKGDSIYVKAEASDADNNLKHLILYVDNIQIRKETLAPFEWGNYLGANKSDELDTLSVGLHTVKIIATDSLGLEDSISFNLSIKEKNVAPTVSFNNPKSLDTTIYFGDQFYVNAAVNDANNNLSFTELFVNNKFLRKESVTPFEWGHFEGSNNITELDTLSVGDYIIKVVATDSAGLTGSKQFSLHVIEAITDNKAQINQLHLLDISRKGNLLKINSTEEGSLSIYDLRGKLMGHYGIITQDSNSNIDISSFESGVYLVMLKSTNNQSIKPLFLK